MVGGIALVYGVIAVAQDTRVFCVPLGGLVLTALGVWSYIRAERRTHRRVQVYEHGLVDLERGETRAFPWASVAEVHQAIVTQRDRRTHVALTTHTYTVTDDSGRAATFDDTIEHVQALGEAIQRAVSERLLAEALRALDQGETVAFGRLAVSRNGVSDGERSLPWSGVESIALERGYVTVTASVDQRNWVTVPAQEIPNVYVLLGLARAATGTRA